ncbi:MULTISPECIES: EamA family transporter [unclassified Myroides]|uniref:EamA family transporter n=1 Tax=unclassified Myroides TaxID=2642485 RepID=UPI003D2F7BB9
MSEKKTAISAALTSIMCVQGGASLAKKLFPVLGPAGASSLRIGLSAILLLLINRPKLKSLTKKQWLCCLGYGCSIGGMNLLFYFAIERVPLGLGVTVEFVGPLLLALFLSRRVLDVLWALLACIGIMLIVPWKSNNVDLLGLGMAFMAGMFWVGYIVMGSKVTQLIDGRTAVSIGTMFAAMIIVPFGIASGGLVHLTWPYFFLGLAVAILSSSLPFTLDLVAMKRIPAKSFSILTSLHPAFAALSGLLFLGEALSLIQWLSVACVVFASIGTTITSPKVD